MSWSSGPLKRLMVPLRRSGVMWNLSPPLSDTSILPALKLSKGCRQACIKEKQLSPLVVRSSVVHDRTVP